MADPLTAALAALPALFGSTGAAGAGAAGAASTVGSGLLQGAALGLGSSALQGLLGGGGRQPQIPPSLGALRGGAAPGLGNSTEGVLNILGQSGLFNVPKVDLSGALPLEMLLRLLNQKR